MTNVKLILSILLFAGAFGCTKSAGEGGSSSIIGKVLVENYNAAGVLQETYYGPDEDVFIIYGNESNTMTMILKRALMVRINLNS